MKYKVEFLTGLACQWRVFWLSAKAVWSSLLQLASSICFSVIDNGKIRTADPGRSDAVQDPASPEDLVKTCMWLPGLLVTLVLACLVMRAQYGLPIRETCLALLMAFLFSFLAVQATGATGEILLPLHFNHPITKHPMEIDITPLTAASTSSQVVLGAEASGQGWTLAKMQSFSLLGGALCAIGASQAAGKPSLPALYRPVADYAPYRSYGRFSSRIPAAYITEKTVAGPGHRDHVREFHCPRRLCLVRICKQLCQRRRCS